MDFSKAVSILRWCVLLATLQWAQSLLFADNSANFPEAWDVAGPARFTATLYEIGSHRQKVLYRFVRTSRRTGSAVRVERQFTTPDGKVAALENVFYESNQLVSYQMKEFRANLSGSIEIGPDPSQAGQSRIRIGYAKGLVCPRGDWQTLDPPTLIDDDLYPFMLAHWDDLMRGESVKFRFVSIEWQRTCNFRLVKIGESVVAGHACEQIAMKPVGFFLSRMVDPLIFTVEKASPCLMLSYLGRTTPRAWNGDAWKYLDAETVFDLDQITPAKR